MSRPAACDLRATYRLQLRNGIGFAEAEALVPYLSALGVSHVYCSPCFEARSGSVHGYDVVDPTRLDPALGGETAFEHFVSALRSHGMGCLLDWVPNHVGIARGENAWWQDVLEFGPASPYADFFDIDWEPARPELRGKLLLPVLGRSYGDVLESGELEPVWQDGFGLRLRYHDHWFPISPTSGARLLRARLLGEAPDIDLPAPTRDGLRACLLPLCAPVRGPRTAARAATGQRALAALVAEDAALREAVQAIVEALRGTIGDRHSFDALHRLLEVQHYRLAYWRVAAEEVNYRRFFDIDQLAALRMERPEVFDRTHDRLLELVQAGWIDGVRIDHVDGLADPRGYCARLRQRASRPDLYLIVEKILGADEVLRTDWPVDGTTGYEFLNELNGLFVDPRGAAPLERLNRRMTGDLRHFEEIRTASKRRVMRALLVGELERLASRLDRIAQGDRWTRDYTRSGLRDALEEIVASFPVYRTYVGEDGASPEDRRCIAVAVAGARRHSLDPESGIFSWIERVLTGDAMSGAPAWRRQEMLGFVTRFQQYTAPVMAKGVEDTSFYRHHRLSSLNEVGGDPGRFGTSPRIFHTANRARSRDWPRTLVSTASHDTKRGEDTRVRIDVLSEMPTAFAERVRDWARRNRRWKRRVAGEPAPSGKDEYLLYQVLLGTWPVREPDAGELAGYRERVQRYLVKALREGKERSSWRHPDAEYEKATEGFVEDLLAHDSPFLEAFRPFAAHVAECGALNGLAAVTLKLCAPGVADTYQGCEGWDLSLADPDNRRPVDFRALEATLSRLQGELGGPDAAPRRAGLEALLAEWRDGRIKLFLTWRLLSLRRAHPRLFVGADYLPVAARGARARNVVAFARRNGAEALVAAAPRLAAHLPRGGLPFPLGRPSWDDTAVVLPRGLRGRRWRDVLTGRTLQPRGDGLELEEGFAVLPVMVLTGTGD